MLQAKLQNFRSHWLYKIFAVAVLLRPNTSVMVQRKPLKSKLTLHGNALALKSVEDT